MNYIQIISINDSIAKPTGDGRYSPPILIGVLMRINSSFGYLLNWIYRFTFQIQRIVFKFILKWLWKSLVREYVYCISKFVALYESEYGANKQQIFDTMDTTIEGLSNDPSRYVMSRYWYNSTVSTLKSNDSSGIGIVSPIARIDLVTYWNKIPLQGQQNISCPTHHTFIFFMNSISLPPL